MFPTREPVKILGLKQTAWYSEHLTALTFAQTLADIGLIGWAVFCLCSGFWFSQAEAACSACSIFCMTCQLPEEGLH